LIYPKRTDTDPDFVGYPFGPSWIQKRYCAAPLRTPSEISTESKSTTKSLKTMKLTKTYRFVKKLQYNQLMGERYYEINYFIANWINPHFQ